MQFAWNPAFGAIQGPFGLAWAQQQPLLELLTAAGLGSRNEIRRLVAQRGLSMLWMPFPDEALYEERLGQDAILHGERLLAHYAQMASDQVMTRGALVWLPVTPHELAIGNPFGPGILVVKRGKHQITRIGVMDRESV